MTSFTTHDNVLIDRPGVEVWLAGVQDKPTRHILRNKHQFDAFCYSGRVFAHRENAVAYRREILLKRRAEIDAELKQLESEVGQ